ncbi:hypothetical protein CCR75_000268 [Bremia lactucae]|uniref:UBC core domain-containing protein n=1 Tax=Bremia lactucae TaxID=4779 RepID=A0A976FEH3_BRELC|nr:hypothetical protein CCR75_000268 [Bremia lactucae]
MAAMRGRMRKEIAMLESDPPFEIKGPDGSPYEKGVFQLEIEIPDRYPFEPPKVRFLTRIYHPNIDDGGRICLDTLKMQPKGSWLPSVNISTLLTTIRLLMAEPNADDGLMADITTSQADIFKQDRELFNRKAAEMTMQYACNLSSLQLKPSVDKSALDEANKVKINEERTRISEKQDAGLFILPNDSNLSDDSFSDGESSSEEEIRSCADRKEYTTPPTKRRRQ